MDRGGVGYSIGKIVKITPRGKFRVKELPTDVRNRNHDPSTQITTYERFVTSFEPLHMSGILINENGEWSSGRFYREYQVISREELERGFTEKYDPYN